MNMVECTVILLLMVCCIFIVINQPKSIEEFVCYVVHIVEIFGCARVHIKIRFTAANVRNAKKQKITKITNVWHVQ